MNSFEAHLIDMVSSREADITITQDGNLVRLLFSEKKGKIVSVMFETYTVFFTGMGLDVPAFKVLIL